MDIEDQPPLRFGVKRRARHRQTTARTQKRTKVIKEAKRMVVLTL